MDTAPEAPSEDRRRRAYADANRLTLTHDERCALAEYLLRRDITSWKQLSDSQMQRLLDAMEGYVLIHSIMLQRGSAVQVGDGLDGQLG